MNDVEKVAACVARKHYNIPQPKEYGWGKPALNLLDCVLSLNRRYYPFVVPRLQEFAEKHPSTVSLSDLRDLIEKYSTPLDFSIQELRYNDRNRAETLLGTVKFLLKVQKKYPGYTEQERLSAWAQAARPSDSRMINIRGFGLGGFQYMRMLSGAQTTKPDIYIRRFVSEAIGRPANDMLALTLLEEAARLLKLRIRDLDEAIWRAAALKKKPRVVHKVEV